jgi:autotransporter-associated beta strand protein
MTILGIAPREFVRRWLAGMCLAIAAMPAKALDVVGYTAAANDRFASGFPSAPVPNTSGSFIGLGYDWSGVGWSATDGTKGFGFVSPRHYLVATHYGGAGSIRVFSSGGALLTGTQQGVAQTGFGLTSGPSLPNPDLSLGTLTAPLSDFGSVARYGVLDLNASSSTDSLANYANQPVIAYGRGANGSSSPRIANTAIFSASSTLYQNPNNGYMITKTTNYTLQVGDSGSPAFITWTNPDGGNELTIIGNNAAVDTTNGNNLQNFIGRAAIMNQLNTMMNPDGFALRIVGNPSATWEGGSGGPSGQNQLNRAGNWSSNSVPTDLYSRFDAATSSIRSLDVNAATNLRGLAFLSTATAADGFTFSGASTLTIGRGGITNYDNSRQTISAPIALGSSQYWDVGSGGVTAGAITTAGFLLEVAGSGTGIISGAVSGTGGVALSGSRLEMSGTSNYTGGTWVHAGALVVNGSIATSSGVTVNAGGSLAGSGAVAAIAGSGSIDPGNSPGILTAPSVNPAGGLDFNFEFTQLGSPTWGTATASGNDVLRLQSGTTPFTASLTSGNAINVYLDVASLGVGNTFRGGFFTDRDADFLPSITNASFNYFLAAEGGTVSYGDNAYNAYTGPYTFDWSTVVESAAFSGGSETGYVSQFVVVPEPGATGLVTLAAMGGIVAARWRRRGMA